MREILFRGRQMKKPNLRHFGRWVQGHYVPCKFPNGKIEHYILRNIVGVDGYVLQRNYVEPETVSQCTGIEDIYGEFIFEGDIVQDDYGLYTVAFCEGTFDSGIYRYHGWVAKDQHGGVDHTPLEHRKFRVVGNIWDDPELLQKEEK